MQLLCNLFRRGKLHSFDVISGLSFAVGAGVLVLISLESARQSSVIVATSIVVPLGSVILIAFIFGPLIFGTNHAVDPRFFATLGLPSQQVSRGLALSALVGLPGVAITVVACAQISTWSRTPLALVVAIVVIPLIIATAILASLIMAVVVSRFFTTQRARKVRGTIGFIALVTLIPVGAVIAQTQVNSGLPGTVDDIATVAGWTPLGAAWAAPAEAASGNWGLALAKIALSLACVGMLWLVLTWIVRVTMVKPDFSPRTRYHKGLGWFARLPDTPLGAVTARSVTYWLRDPRYSYTLAAVVVAPILFVVVLAVAGVPTNLLALVPLPSVCLFLAWSIHNDLAFDNTALWVHLVSRLKGSVDRLGRVLFPLMIGVPLVLIGSPISAGIYGDWALLPAIIGVNCSILFAGLGVSSITSVRLPYSVTQPGDSAFTQPVTQGSVAGLSQALALIAPLIITLPTVFLVVMGFVVDGAIFYSALPVGVLIGLGALRYGIRSGGAIFDRRAPELLALAMRS